jgi:hypothetical protein
MIEQLVKILSDFIFKQLAVELERQGHKLTGALLESFEAKIQKKTEDTLTIDFLMLNYGLSLNNGIKPEKIPYTIGGPPRGGTSKYIEGLIKFAKLRFSADQRRATQIAFAIATKQKREGYPLTGKIGFIDNVLNGDEGAIAGLIEERFKASLELLIEEFTKNKL